MGLSAGAQAEIRKGQGCAPFGVDLRLLNEAELLAFCKGKVRLNTLRELYGKVLLEGSGRAIDAARKRRKVP